MAQITTNQPQQKFGRGYRLTVENHVLGTKVTVELPFTIEFDIKRTNYASSNYAQIRIFNLGEQNRNAIRLDKYARYENYYLLSVTLQAGYGDNPSGWPTIFEGQASRAYSQRQGTEFVTTIEAFDAGRAFQQAYTSLAPKAGRTVKGLIGELFQDLARFGVKPGEIGNFPGTFEQNRSFSGQTVELLHQYTNGNFSVDNGVANALLPNEHLPNPNNVVYTITSASGLLSTPLLEEAFVLVDMLFEPGIKINMQVNIQAFNNRIYNGLKTVTGIQHRGTISAAVCGEAKTSLSLRGDINTPALRALGVTQ